MAQTSALLYGAAEELYMNACQLRYFQERLLGWRRRLHASLEMEPRIEQEAAETCPDWVDVASAQTQAELLSVNRQRAVALIREIDAALQRIRDGRYGYCVETGEEIGLKRLNAMPTARFSIVVQEEREQRRRIRY